MSWVAIRDALAGASGAGVGDTVTIKGWVREVNVAKQRIGLTLRQIPDRDPWERIEMRYQEGQVVDGIVENGADFGVFVELEHRMGTARQPAQCDDVAERAVGRIKEILETDPTAADKVLRLSVQGGGCAGFQYTFSFDDKQGEIGIRECARRCTVHQSIHCIVDFFF